jgi:hypothetical protein
MPYWEIFTDTNIDHGSDILGRNAKVTFIVNPVTGEMLNAQPTGTIFAWRTANRICFSTNYLVSPFLVTPWQSGVISITTPSGVINKTFSRASFLNNNH